MNATDTRQKTLDAVYGGAVQDLVFTALTDTRFYGLNPSIPSLCFGASGGADARLQRICLAAQINQGYRAVHRRMVRGGGDLETGASSSLRSRALRGVSKDGPRQHDILRGSQELAPLG